MKNQIKFLSLDDMWGIKGRIGRLHYALVIVRLVVLSFAIFSFLPVGINLLVSLGVTPVLAQSVLFSVVFIAFILCFLSLVMRRLQDIGYPYWVVLIMVLLGFLIPGAGDTVILLSTLFVFMFLGGLLLVPGESKDNEYGVMVENPSAPGFRWMKSTTQGIAVLGIIFVMAGFLFLSFQKYIPEEYLPESLKVETVSH